MIHKDKDYYSWASIMHELSSRRRFLSKLALTSLTIGATSHGVSAFPSLALNRPPLHKSPLIHAQAKGLQPGLPDDQSDTFQRLLNLSAERDVPVFLPGGVYKVGGLKFPKRARVIGVPGSTRLAFNGNRPFASARQADLVHLHGIIFDGLGIPFQEEGAALFSAETVLDLRISACDFVGSGGHGLDVTGTSGHISQCRFRDIADIALFAKQSRGLSITDNDVADCGNGGILIHRFTPGEDGTIVASNRIERIKSRNGGTGQWGNGINVFRAHNVMVSNNRIADCAFSSVRVNTGNNVQIIGNNCSRSGETALYSEFTFQGALIANNLVEGGTIGISLANFNDGGRLATVSGNVIRNLTNRLPYDNPGNFKPGIGIYAEADTTIIGNAIENVPQAGIHVGWGEFCRNVIVSQNVVHSAPWGVTASVVSGAENVTITDNVFGDISQQAITGFEWVKPVTRELLGARRTGYSHLSVSGNRLS